LGIVVIELGGKGKMINATNLQSDVAILKLYPKLK